MSTTAIVPNIGKIKHPDCKAARSLYIL